MDNRFKKPAPLYLQDDQWDTPAVAQTKHLVKSDHFMEKDRDLLGAIFRDRDIWVLITGESLDIFESVEKAILGELGDFDGLSAALYMIRSHLYDLRAAMGHVSLFQTADGFKIANIKNRYDNEEVCTWGDDSVGTHHLAISILDAYAPCFDDPENEYDEPDYMDEGMDTPLRAAVWNMSKEFAEKYLVNMPALGGCITIDEVHNFLLEHGIHAYQLDVPDKICRYWG